MHLARFVLRYYNRLFRPRTLGVRVLVRNGEGQILLVHHRGSKQWYLPGGGVKSQESLKEAASRELREETRLHLLPNSLKLFGAYTSHIGGKRDTVILYTAHVKQTHIVKKTCLEILQAGFYPIDALPLTISAGTKRRIEELTNNQKETDRW